MSNNNIVKIELNFPEAFIESIKNNLKENNFDTLEEFLSEAARQYAQQTKGKTTPKYRLIGVNLHDQELLNNIAKANDVTVEQGLTILLRNSVNWEKMKQQQVNEATVAALELALCHINNTEDSSDLKKEVSGDLIAARATLEVVKNGKLDPELVKKWALELFA